MFYKREGQAKHRGPVRPLHAFPVSSTPALARTLLTHADMVIVRTTKSWPTGYLLVLLRKSYSRMHTAVWVLDDRTINSCFGTWVCLVGFNQRMMRMHAQTHEVLSACRYVGPSFLGSGHEHDHSSVVRGGNETTALACCSVCLVLPRNQATNRVEML